MGQDREATPAQRISERTALQQRVAHLEASEAALQRAEATYGTHATIRKDGLHPATLMRSCQNKYPVPMAG